MSEPVADKLSQMGALLKNGTKGNVLFADLTALAHENVTEDLFEQLAELSKLKEVHLAGLPVTDQMLQHLAVCSALQVVDLTDTLVTDQTLDLLVSFEKLKIVQLSGSQVTAEKIAAIRKQMIDTRIVYR
jgi:phosphoglycerate dehydrogenase-like enzyme